MEYSSPCDPSPCGIHAKCEENNGVGSCTCIESYFGNPFEGCRPECVINSDCAPMLACIQNKCKDPCPGVCAQNAICQVVNHLPSCYCPPGKTGNAYVNCVEKVEGMFYNFEPLFLGLLNVLTFSLLRSSVEYRLRETHPVYSFAVWTKQSMS